MKRFLLIFAAAAALVCIQAAQLPSYAVVYDADSSEEVYQVLLPTVGGSKVNGELYLPGVGIVQQPAIQAVKVKVPTSGYYKYTNSFWQQFWQMLGMGGGGGGAPISGVGGPFGGAPVPAVPLPKAATQERNEQAVNVEESVKLEQGQDGVYGVNAQQVQKKLQAKDPLRALESVPQQTVPSVVNLIVRNRRHLQEKASTTIKPSIVVSSTTVPHVVASKAGKVTESTAAAQMVGGVTAQTHSNVSPVKHNEVRAKREFILRPKRASPQTDKIYEIQTKSRAWHDEVYMEGSKSAAAMDPI